MGETSEASKKSNYEKREVEAILRDVEELKAEMDRLLDIVNSDSRISARAVGEVQEWKELVRSRKRRLEEKGYDPFAASGQLYFALGEMENAWSSLKQASQGNYMAHSTSLQLLEKAIKNAKAYIAQGDY